jgi:aryl-alcohol dehydrogenase-like predicted oxidoreductase
MTPRRPLGGGLSVTPVGLGLWPIAGMTTLGTTDKDSLATIRAAIDAGINFFDTAWCYGTDGISERLLGQATRDCRDRVVVATKCGIHWAGDGSRINDASPRRLRAESAESLQRLGVECVDLLYLHSADGRTPVAESAGELGRLREEGRCHLVGASNLSFADLQQFHATTPLAAVQYRFNLLQREIGAAIIPWCRERGIAVVVYWPLMKGLLAGKLRRGWQFDPADRRLDYPMFRSPEWDWNQDLLDELETIAIAERVTIAQLVVGWTIRQSGITAALCGAKRPGQIEETAAVQNQFLSPAALAAVEAAAVRRLERTALST